VPHETEHQDADRRRVTAAHKRASGAHTFAACGGRTLLNLIRSPPQPSVAQMTRPGSPARRETRLRITSTTVGRDEDGADALILQQKLHDPDGRPVVEVTGFVRR